MDEKNMTGAAIELDRVYELRLTHKALRRFSARTKLGVSELEDAVERYDILSVLLWAMLADEIPGLTDERLDELIDAAIDAGRLDIVSLMATVAAAVEDGFGTAPEADATLDDDAERPTTAAGGLETL